MNIRRQVYNILSASTAFETCGLVAPSSASTPYVVFAVVSDVPGHTHAGHDDTAETRVQVSCYSTSYEGAFTCADNVFDALTQTTTPYGIKIPRRVNELDSYDHDLKLYSIPVDFMLSRVAHSTST